MPRTNIEQLKKRIARNVRHLRENHGLTQLSLGKAMGVAADGAQSCVSHLESGKRCLSLDMLVRLSRALDVDPAEIFRV